MHSRYSVYLRILTLLCDLVCINLALIAAYSICLYQNIGTEHGLQKLFLVYNFLWLAVAFVLHLYNDQLNKIELFFRRTWKSLLFHFIVFSFFTLFIDTKLTALFYAAIFVADTLLFACSRFLITYAVQYIHRRVQPGKKIAIIGYNETAEKLAEYFGSLKGDFRLEGFFDDELAMMNAGVDMPLSVIGPIDNCISYATRNNVQEIYSTILPRQNTKIDTLVRTAEANCIRVKFVPDFYAGTKSSYHVDHVGMFPVLSLRREPLEKIKNRIKKRLFDIIISSMVIICVLSWLIPLLAVLIKLSSRGPVFFRQQRSGRDNKSFWCYKFRSMRVNTDSDMLQATKDDERITRIGAFIRRTSLDEFPQFFNVLLGNMSIVGPRPHMVLHTEQYSSVIDNYMIRHFLKPGITGWAQVNGYRGETETETLMQKRVEHDIWYMENWSLMLDVRIFFMTIIEIIRPGKKAF